MRVAVRGSRLENGGGVGRGQDLADGQRRDAGGEASAARGLEVLAQNVSHVGAGQVNGGHLLVDVEGGGELAKVSTPGEHAGLGVPAVGAAERGGLDVGERQQGDGGDVAEVLLGCEVFSFYRLDVLFP